MKEIILAIIITHFATLLLSLVVNWIDFWFFIPNKIYKTFFLFTVHDPITQKRWKRINEYFKKTRKFVKIRKNLYLIINLKKLDFIFVKVLDN